MKVHNGRRGTFIFSFMSSLVRYAPVSLEGKGWELLQNLTISARGAVIKETLQVATDVCHCWRK